MSPRSGFARELGTSPWIGFWALSAANVRVLYRNRQVLVFNVLVPLLLIVIFGGLFQRSQLNVDLVGAQPELAVLRAALPSSSYALHVVSPSTARSQVLNGGAEFALEVVGESPPLTVRVLENSANVSENGSLTAAAMGAVAALNQSLLHREPAVRGQVVGLHPPGGASSGSLARTNYIEFLAPGVLAYAVLNGGLSAGLRLVGDRERGVLRRIRATPLPIWAFLLASVVSQLALVAIQIAVLLGVGHALYGIGLGPSPGPLLLLLLVGSLCFLAGGFLIAALSRREQSAIVMSNLVSLPQLFVAGVFYPLAGSPLWLQKLSEVMPLTYFSNGLRGLMAQGQGLSETAVDFYVLVGVGIVVLLVAARTFRFQPTGAGG